VSGGHERVEGRRCGTIRDAETLAHVDPDGASRGLRALAMVEAERRVGEAVTHERRYDLTRVTEAKQVERAVRQRVLLGQVGIENGLHWVRDGAFREDECRVRVGQAAENFVVLRHRALNLLKGARTLKVGVKAKRLRAGWDEQYLREFLLLHRSHPVHPHTRGDDAGPVRCLIEGDGSPPHAWGRPIGA